MAVAGGSGHRHHESSATVVVILLSLLDWSELTLSSILGSAALLALGVSGLRELMSMGGGAESEARLGSSVKQDSRLWKVEQMGT